MTGIEFIRDLAVVLGVAGAIGWVCQRLNLSLVVGYLVAGAIIGPHTPPFQLVTDRDRIQMLAQVGLVFQIFSIGLDLSFQRLRRLGLPVIFATVIGAVLVFHGCRFFGATAGWTETQSLFLAGMLMVSSSVIISKVLKELNTAHRREGQLALGITVMEDTVAIVMLAILSTLIQVGGQKGPPLAQILGALTAFIVFLLLAGLFFVPRLLLRLTQGSRAEVRTVVVIALLLGLAWSAQQAGYSMALGAFLLGVVVASTPQKLEIERAFEGLRDMFGAVFFVAMGMLVDFRLLASAWPLVLAVTAFALVWRSASATIALVLTGSSTRESVRAGLAVTPLGEFSFVIAQIGVAAGMVPESFFPTAVGASLLTTLAAPWLMRRSGAISTWVDQALPLVLREWIAFYHSWLERIVGRQQQSLLWKLTSRRVVPVAAQMLTISALILFARPLFGWIRAQIGDDWLFPHGTGVIFWTVFGALVLAPLVAIWRNVEALSLILAEWVTKETPRNRTLRPLLERALQSVGAIVLMLWLMTLLPFDWSVWTGFLAVVGVIAILAAVLWRRLVYWQSRVEIELLAQFQSAAGGHEDRNLKRWLEEQHDLWRLQAEEFVLPDFSSSAGRGIGELALRKRFGCSIASIDRHGILIRNPSAAVTLFPADKLLLLGSAEQIDRAMLELSKPRIDAALPEMEEFSLEALRVPDHGPAPGRTLAELDPYRQAGVQVAGIQRGTTRILTPSGSDRLESGDELLVLGSTKQVLQFKEWLQGGSFGPRASSTPVKE